MHPVQPRNILLVRPSALGDVCRTVPLVASLKRAFPDAGIDWLVQDSFAGAIEAHPGVRRVIPFPRRQLGQLMRTGRLLSVLGWTRSLAGRDYDLAIDAQGLFRSAFFTWSSRAPRRVGYANAPEGAPLFYNVRVRVDRKQHAVDRMLALLEPIGVEPIRDMRLHSSASARRAAAALCPPGSIVVAPTSRWASKRWPITRFCALVERLLDDTDAVIAIVGGPGEEDQCAPLVELAGTTPRVLDLIGRTSVQTLAAVIESSRLVIANDSAALHMAVGFDRPIVALFGPTDVMRVGPYGRAADVIQHRRPDEPFDHKNDAHVAFMERIEVDEVLDACLCRLRAATGAPSGQ
ncbi:MAG: lipopolysaccharide heptosyltransferase II [Phycisphaerales bacterium]